MTNRQVWFNEEQNEKWGLEFLEFRILEKERVIYAEVITMLSMFYKDLKN